MDRKIEKSLFDIIQCIEEIESYFVDFPRQFEAYCNSALLKSAIHMNLSIIGEATNRILKLSPEIQISNARQIIGTRNYIIHGYDSLRPEMIWESLSTICPNLKPKSLLTP